MGEGCTGHAPRREGVLQPSPEPTGACDCGQGLSRGQWAAEAGYNAHDPAKERDAVTPSCLHTLLMRRVCDHHVTMPVPGVKPALRPSRPRTRWRPRGRRGDRFPDGLPSDPLTPAFSDSEGDAARPHRFPSPQSSQEANLPRASSVGRGLYKKGPAKMRNVQAQTHRLWGQSLQDCGSSGGGGVPRGVGRKGQGTGSVFCWMQPPLALASSSPSAQGRAKQL